jgi:hypothetical protein
VLKPVVPSNGRPRHFRRPAAATAAIALSATLLVGCGGSSDGAEPKPATETTSAPDSAASLPADMPQRPACALVTRAEVEAATGARVNPGQETVEAARSMCIFTVAGGGDERVGVVAVTSSGVPAFFTTARSRLTSPQPVRAADEAFVSGGQAVVRRGNTMVAIVVVLRRDPPQLAAVSTKLAQAVGSHM